MTRFISIALCTVWLACSIWAAEPGTVFPPQKQAMKIVFDKEGSDWGDYPGYGSKLLSYLGDFGVDMTRVGAGWGGVEKVRGVYDWSEPDVLFGFLGQRGIEFECTMCSTPDWSRVTHSTDEQRAAERGLAYHSLVMPKLESLDELSKWAEALARRYKKETKYFEWWNEPDGIAGPVIVRDKEGRIIAGKTGGDPVHYALTLKAVHDGLKRGNPDAVLAAGSLSVFSTGFLEAIYATVGKDAFEAVSFHPYSARGVEVPWMEDLRRVSVRYGHLDCGMWANEYSWHEKHRSANFTTYGIGPGAERVPEDGVSICAQYPYVTQVLLHTLNDWGYGLPPEDNPNAGFGMVTSEPKPKPHYGSFEEAQLWRRDSQSRELCLNGPHVVFPETDFEVSFDSTARPWVGKVEWSVPEGWTVKPGKDAHTFVFRAPADSASPRPYPVTAQREDGTAFTRYIEVVEPVQLTSVVPVQGAKERSPAIIEMKLINLSSKPIRVSPRVDAPEGFQFTDTAPRTVRPGETALRLIVKPDERLTAPPAGVYPAKAYVVIDGRATGEYEFQLPVELYARAVRNTLTIDGDLRDWVWFGWWDEVQIPGDASPSRLMTAWDEDYFYIAVTVDDETHVQTMPPQEFWREDGIQIGIDAAHDAKPGSVYSFNDQEIQAALKDGESIVYRLHADYKTYGGALDTVKFKSVRSANRTTYEMAIPWDEIKPAKPAVGAHLGLCVTVQDKDADERKTSSWGNGILREKRPIKFGWVRLVTDGAHRPWLKTK